MKPSLTKREQIADQIRSDVLSQKLQKGTNLREQALAQRFKVSRIPVRDALLQLTQEGLLVAKPNYGVKVDQLPAGEMRPLLVKLRQEIEVFALDRVFARIDSVQEAPLRRILRDLNQACQAGDLSAVVPCDMAFHRWIIDAAQCPKLLPVWLPIITRMLIHYSHLNDWMESYEQHAAIVKAILQRNPREARRRLLANIT